MTNPDSTKKTMTPAGAGWYRTHLPDGRWRQAGGLAMIGPHALLSGAAPNPPTHTG